MPVRPLRPLCAVFHGIVYESRHSRGSTGQLRARLLPGSCAQGMMPNVQTLEGTGTRGKGQSPFISNSNLSKK